MVEPSKESITVRNAKLDKLFCGKISLDSHHLASRESLLDALFVLYDECNSDFMKKDKHTSTFIDKFRPIITELRKLRVNVNDFEVKKIIGRGHYGEVQVVREKQTDHVYAMKILRKRDTLAQQNVAFYEEERDIMAKAQSPWITQLHYAFQNNKNLYLIMDFHPGGDLLSLMSRYDECMSEEMTRFYVAEITLAIHSLHTMGYVHRDIKPDNILIDRIGHIKLADFGSAAKLTSAGTVISKMPVGTPDYIAPEVLNAINSNEKLSTSYGVECDWWSLGIVAYEMLCGVTPFYDEKDSLTYNNIINHKKTFKWPENGENISPEAKNIISGLLEEAINRLGYQQLYKHKFFNSINWTNIRNTVAPFIPKITSQDDTSNFDEYERQTLPPSIEDLKTKREFSGQNLPFVGFTYTKNLVSKSDRRSISFDSPRRVSFDVQLSNKKQEAAELQQRIHTLEQTEFASKKQSELLQMQLSNKDKLLTVSEKTRENLEKDVAKYSTEIIKLKRRLDMEINERSSNEQKALQLVSDMKMKWKRREEELKKSIEKKDKYLDDLKNECLALQGLQQTEAQIQEELAALKQELKKTKSEATEYKNELAKTMKNKKENVDELKVLLQELSDNNKVEVAELKKQIAEAVREKEEMEKELEQMKVEFETKSKQLKTTSEVCMKEHIDEFTLAEIETLKRKFVKQEEKLNALEEAEFSLKEKQLAINELEERLLEENRETKEIKEKIKNYELKLNKLFEGFTAHQTNLQQKEKEVVDQMNDVDHMMKEEADEKIRLRCELQASENKLQEFQLKIEELQSVNDMLKENFEKLQQVNQTLKQEKDAALATNSVQEQKEPEGAQEFKFEKEFLENQISKLEKQIEVSRESCSKERQKVKQFQDDLYKCQKECSDVKLDLRIAQRESKQGQEKIAALEAEIESKEKKCKEFEDQIAVMHDKEEMLNSQLQRLETELDDKKQSLSKQEQKFEEAKKRLEDRIESLEKAGVVHATLQTQLGKMEGQYEEIVKRNTVLEDTMKSLENEKKKSDDDARTLKNTLDEKIKMHQKLEKNATILKTTLTALEEQLEDFEKLVGIHEEKEATLRNEKEKLIELLARKEKELEDVQYQLKNANVQKEKAEKKVRDLEDKISENKANFSSETTALKEKLHDQKAATSEYNEMLNEREKNISILEISLRNAQCRNKALEEEIGKLKEESSALITSIQNLRDEKFKLAFGLEEAIEKCESAQLRNEELEDALEALQSNQEVEVVKLKSTLHQQSKLINFLQQKTENLSKKKKTFQEKIFGRNVKSTELSPLHESQMQYAKDKSIRKIHDNTFPRADVHSKPKISSTLSGMPNLNTVLSTIVQSPGTQTIPVKNSKSREVKPTEERMHHKIPHRFQTDLNMRAIKCSACLDTIHFGRKIAKCAECSLTVHPKCSSSVLNTCGLPTGLMQHFRRSLRQKSFKSSENKTEKEGIQPQGWVKIPRKGKTNWENVYARSEGTLLRLYDKDNMNFGNCVEEFELCPSNGETIVHSAVSASELPNTVKSDIPFVLKLEAIPSTTCWPRRTLYIMAPNFSTKQTLVSSLEAIVQQYGGKETRDAKLLGSIILHLEVNSSQILDINCSYQFNNDILLLGAEEGLFILYLNDNSRALEKIEGIDCVFQITIIRSLNCVLLISENERVLNQIDLITFDLVLTSESKELPKSSVQPVENISCCHLFEVSQSLDSVYVCAATVDRLSILKWHTDVNTFVSRKKLVTAEPCSCILFTKHSVLVGADKFFEIDLKDLKVEEFLDASDATLNLAVYGTMKLNSFPVAILLMSAPNQPEEFLLCFHEFGVFVDIYGRRTRKGDMKWIRLPLAFAYRSPYLFVTHFNSLEVIEIPTAKDKLKNKNAFLDIYGPRYLGPAKDNSSIYLASVQEHAVEVLRLQGNLAAMPEIWNSKHETEESEVSSEMESSISVSEFSFTSSVLQVLDPSTEDLSHISNSSESVIQYKDTPV